MNKGQPLVAFDLSLLLFEKGGRRTPCNQKKNGAAEISNESGTMKRKRNIYKNKGKAGKEKCKPHNVQISSVFAFQERDVCALRDANSSCLPFPNPPPLLGGKQKALHHVAHVLLRSQFLSCPQFRTVNIHIVFLDN